MENWDQKPDVSETDRDFEIMRVPARTALQAVVTSQALDGLPVHYWNGRTIPHRSGTRCLPCESGRSYRWMCYLGIWVPRTGLQAILEATAKVHRAFEQFAERAGQIRGCGFRIWRPSQQAHGRIVVEFRKDPSQSAEIPPAPPVREIMERIWQPAIEIAERMIRVRPPDVPSNGAGINNRPRSGVDVESPELGQGGV